MIPRARLPLLCVYAFLTACGVISLVTPVESVQTVAGLKLLVTTWGVFFFVGGITSLVALAARWKGSSAIGWWYIEIAGICLLVASTFLYSSVLFTIAYRRDNFGIAGVGCLVTSLAVFLIDRAIDARRTARYERRILDETTRRDRED